MGRKQLCWLGALPLALVIVVMTAYRSDMRAAYGRIDGRGKVINSPWGDLEYVRHGAGDPVLVIHGAGGGFDQGELLADAVLGDGFDAIIPSRFGYLGSAMPPDATWDDQANALAYLLDELGIEQAAVLALSQGGPAALLLAVLHPDRVSSVTCLSCGVAASDSEAQAEAGGRGDMLRTVFARDYRYWAASRFFKGQLMGLLGADRDVIADLTPEERRLATQVIDFMNPAAPRSAGVVLDNEAVMPGERIRGIAAPTLIIHARDDLLQLYHNAEFAATTIPNARLMSFAHGGHLVMIVERAAIGAAVARHIRTHSSSSR